MTDAEVLSGFFFNSRYITRDVYNRYGMNPTMYVHDPGVRRIRLLRDRLCSKLRDNEFYPIASPTELRGMLGDEFDWVMTMLPAHHGHRAETQGFAATTERLCA